jgi:rare lipoprotein A
VRAGGGRALLQTSGFKPLRAGLCAAALSAMLAACNSGQFARSGIDPRLGVAPSPRVAQDGEPIAAGGGRYKLGKAYQIAGRWYEPKHNPDYDKTGRASWYGSAFHGRRTANGEVFDKDALTAAHPTLPLPSYVRVTNLENARSVMVRVNDRGPFGKGRIIDVSRRTAEMLGFKHDGTADVRVEYVDLAPLDGRDRDLLMASYQAPADGPSAAPVMVAYAGERPAMPGLDRLDAAMVAAGTPFDPYRALIAAQESGIIQPVAARTGGTPVRAPAWRSSYAANQRVSAAFDAIAGLDRATPPPTPLN